MTDKKGVIDGLEFIIVPVMIGLFVLKELSILLVACAIVLLPLIGLWWANGWIGGV